MAAFFHCDLCHMNRRGPEAAPGICKYCADTLDRRRTFPSTVCDRIRSKDAAGFTLTPVEFAIARVMMQPFKIQPAKLNRPEPSDRELDARALQMLKQDGIR